MYFGYLAAMHMQGAKVKTLLATITSSGNWTVPAGVTEVDVYLVGGGGGGGNGSGSSRRGGGGGGYCKLYQDITVTPSSSISIVIGAGGSPINNGGYTQFKDSNYKANGGYGSVSPDGGNGGSGGGGYGGGQTGGDGGSNGSDGENATGVGGTGGGTVDYTPTNPYNNTRYGGGGGGATYNYTTEGGKGMDGGGDGARTKDAGDGIPNTGGGGGGVPTTKYNGGDGGSGVCFIYG